MTEAVQAFEAHLRFKRKAERTIIQYRPVLRAFAAWAGDRSPATVRTFEIQGFLEHWLSEFRKRNAREPSDHATKGVVVALRSFYRYLHAYGLLLADGQHVPNPMLAIELPVIEQKQNDWLRQAEDEALLGAYTATEDERIIIWFLRWSGLRVGEALSLPVREQVPRPRRRWTGSPRWPTSPNAMGSPALSGGTSGRVGQDRFSKQRGPWAICTACVRPNRSPTHGRDGNA